jgi:phosphatidylethanolamine/phosphatidyl-N-methylethanolamine N-methyltransferase
MSAVLAQTVLKRHQRFTNASVRGNFTRISAVAGCNRDGDKAMDLRDTIRTYRWVSGSYDFVFGPVFHPGRKDAVRIANDRPGQRILEVGVGTGLSLPHFRPDSHVTGIDVSAEMLAKAEARVQQQNLAHVDALRLMDAENLEFADNSFDAVLALYVAPVVPNPARFAAEMRRVCIPGGTIVLVNHFMSNKGAVRFFEKKLAHLARHIGFHPDFEFDRFMRDSQLTVREIRPSNLFGYWKLLRCVNEKDASTLD